MYNLRNKQACKENIKETTQKSAREEVQYNGHRPIRLTQCCTQFKSPREKILCVFYLHYNVAFTFK